MTETRLTMNDLRTAGHCPAGIRAFFLQHGVDLRRLVREGIPVSELEHIDDANLKLVIAIAEERNGNGEG